MAEIDKYWSEKEKELKKKILGKYLCKYLNGSTGIKLPRWGILFFTEDMLCFESYKNENWISVLSIAKKNENSEAVFLKWAWSKIVKAALSKKSPWWERLSAPGGRLLNIIYRREYNSTDQKIIFLLTDNSEELEEFLKMKYGS